MALNETHSWVSLMGGDLHGHRVQIANDLIESAEPEQAFQPSGSKTTWRFAEVTLKCGDKEEQQLVLVPVDSELANVLYTALLPKDGKPAITEAPNVA